MEETDSRIVIALDQAEPAPKGELSATGAPDRPFASWIGLISALELAVEGTAASRAATARALTPRTNEGR